MLEKGVVSFPFTNSWYLPAFYVGNGCTLFGDGTDESKGVDFGGENAVEVTNYLIDLRNNPNFKIDADGSGIAGRPMPDQKRSESILTVKTWFLP